VLERARATALLWLGRADETEQQLRKLVTRTVLDDWMLTGVRLLRGQVEEAAAQFPRIIERGAVIVREIDTGRLYADAGRLQDAAAHLERAFAMDASCARWVTQNPQFTKYLDDPAVRPLLARYLAGRPR
jgi:predicted Zn-dependent protease